MNSVNNEDNNQINEKVNFLSQDMLFIAKMFNISCTFAVLTFVFFTCLLFCSYSILKKYMQIDTIDEFCRFVFIVSILALLALLLNAYLIHKLCQINKREMKKFKKKTKKLYELLFVYLENNKNNNKEERKNE